MTADRDAAGVNSVAIRGGIVAVAIAAAVMRLVLGAQWFSLYGWAAIVLLLLFPLGRALLQSSRRRWPVWVLIAVTAVAALIQIGFWLAFFHAGPSGLFLGIGRSMALPHLDTAARWSAGALALIWSILLARAFTGETRRSALHR